MESQRGSALVMVSLCGMVLLGCAALAIDFGRVTLTRTRLQRVADAAALAGGKDMPISPTRAQAAALDFANRNGLALAAGDVTFPSANSIRVQVSRPVPTVFARAFGTTSYPVPAAATARIQQATSVNGLRPWGIPEQDFRDYTEGTTYQLKLTGQSGEYTGKGNFHALSLDTSGADEYKDTIKYGSKTRWHVGDQVPTEPGNMIGPTRQGAEYLFGSDAHTSYADAVAAGESNCPRVITVVVVKEDSFGAGRTELEIAGFASFFISSWQNPDEIQGQFIRYIDMNAASNGSLSTTGTQAIALID